LNTKKRLYIGLLAISLILILLIGFLLYILVSNRDIVLNQILLISISTIAVIMFAILLGGIISIVLVIVRDKSTPSMETLGQTVKDTLFPVALLTGRLIGINRENILQSYIQVNNYLVGLKDLCLKGNQILILAPHCMQNSECPYKITMNVNNCRDCGKCDITSLKKLAKENNAILRIATGGTLARKFIKDTNPKGVIAIACERDLSLGIHEIRAIPVIGVLNCRPQGPCINTRVDLGEVEKALQSIIKEE
jgi:hypothetical protein